MAQTPQQWVYSALVGMSLLLAGWLWQMVGTLREDVQRLQELKADISMVQSKAGDRWTGQQQEEYRAYVDARLVELSVRMEACREQLERDIEKLHPKIR